MSKSAYAWISASESASTEKGHWNIEKASKYDQDEAKVISYMTECLKEDDQGLIAEHVLSTYLTKIQTFEFDESSGIDASWKRIKGHRRKLIAADSSLSKATPDKILFFILLLKIPQKYSVLIDGFRTRTDPSIKDKIPILKSKEEDNRKEAHATAKFRRHRPIQDSDVSMRDPPLDCYECASENHILGDFPYLKRARIYARKLREADEQRLLKSSKSKGYAVCGESDLEADETLNSESDSESDGQYQEAVHLSKELISKSSPDDWILDTGATSSMTDKRHLFRGPLKRIKGAVIKVRGGNWYSEHQVLAKIECKDVTSALMRNVYFVPKLGVNLLSARKLCRTGIEGISNGTSIKIVHHKIPIIIAEQKDGLRGETYCETTQRKGPFYTCKEI
ncbi:hypothetical protein K3495_g4262 [Podosphaera aphanis]|nr:hypothetical protein K3495_g4262 [Podosphaera aphanis]